MDGKKVSVSIEATNEVVARFHTVAEAEQYVADRQKIEPEAVHDGKYSIDAPEELVNPK